jgi:hypothetical protein
VLNFCSFLLKTRAFLVKTSAFSVPFEAIFNAKYFFALLHPAQIAYLRQLRQYVAFIRAFCSKVFGDFG